MNDHHWFCGAFEHPTVADLGYRCTRPFDHDGNHEAQVDGEVVARWPNINCPPVSPTPSGDNRNPR